jgi:hypothetical protein
MSGETHGLTLSPQTTWDRVVPILVRRAIQHDEGSNQDTYANLRAMKRVFSTSSVLESANCEMHEDGRGGTARWLAPMIKT